MKRVALTGGIATGKSHVRAELEKMGIPTIDADVLAREVVAPGTPALTAIVARFGRDVLDEHGGLDRRKLGAVVFADSAARQDLERIVHPAVRAAIDVWFDSLDPERHPVAIADIPLLYETAREREFDAVIVTACQPETQLRRVMSRDSLSEQEAKRRIAAQLPTEDKVRRADYVVWTDGPFDETAQQVHQIARSLTVDETTKTQRRDGDR